MASRRSRLQVKPNIGGPKAKAPPKLKIQDQGSKKLDSHESSRASGSPVKSPRTTSPIKSPRATSPLKSPKVTSPVKSVKVFAPLKGPKVTYPIKETTEDKVDTPLTFPQIVVSSPVKSSPSEVSGKEHTKESKSGQNSNKSEGHNNVSDKADEKVVESSKKDDSKSESAPTRARLRRFGKVNIPTASRGAKPTDVDTKTVPSGVESLGDTVNDKGDGTNKSSQLEHDKKTGGEDPKPLTDAETGGKGDDVSQDQIDGRGSERVDDLTKETAVKKDKPKVPTRARLPKAKPNILDASRKRARASDGNSAGKPDTNSESLASVPQPSVASTNVSAIDTGTHLGNSDTEMETEPAVKMTSIQPKLTLPKSPTKSFVAYPLPASPVKAVEKKTMGEKDKWARPAPAAASEQPPVKRQRRPKVTAPTDKPPDRAKMTMRDLIRWNPSSNPMKPKEFKQIGIVEPKTVEKENKVKEVEMDNDVIEDEAMPVPQVTIGPDGNIVVNETSLVVKNTMGDKGPSQDDEPIDETEMFTTYGSFRTKKNSKRWSQKETAKFYKALAMVGIDFFLMQKIMPNRKRYEIKKKFKNEEKKNSFLIESALKDRIQFDDRMFEEQSDSEDEEETQKRLQKEKKEKKKKEQAEKKAMKEKNSADKKTEKKKKSLKTRAKCSQYYSSSDSEDEEKVLKDLVEMVGGNTEDPDETWQPLCVSKAGKDSEVVGILMDMSEGRLPGNNTNVENNFQTNNGSGQKPIDVDIMSQSYADDTVTNHPVMAQQLYGDSNHDLLKSLPQHIPGIQSIITFQTSQMGDPHIDPGSIENNTSLILENAANVAARTAEVNSAEIISTAYKNDENSVLLTQEQGNPNFSSPNQFMVQNSNQINPAEGAETSQGETQQFAQAMQIEASPTNENSEVKMENQSVTSPLGEVEAMPLSAQVPTPVYNANQIISQQLLSPTSAAQFPGLPHGNPGDQYVLVTVMPEVGQETVIHVYRLHGDGQGQTVEDVQSVAYGDVQTEPMDCTQSATQGDVQSLTVDKKQLIVDGEAKSQTLDDAHPKSEASLHHAQSVVNNPIVQNDEQLQTVNDAKSVDDDQFQIDNYSQSIGHEVQYEATDDTQPVVQVDEQPHAVDDAQPVIQVHQQPHCVDDAQPVIQVHQHSNVVDDAQTVVQVHQQQQAMDDAQPVVQVDKQLQAMDDAQPVVQADKQLHAMDDAQPVEQVHQQLQAMDDAQPVAQAVQQGQAMDDAQPVVQVDKQQQAMDDAQPVIQVDKQRQAMDDAQPVVQVDKQLQDVGSAKPVVHGNIQSQDLDDAQSIVEDENTKAMIDAKSEVCGNMQSQTADEAAQILHSDTQSGILDDSQSIVKGDDNPQAVSDAKSVVHGGEHTQDLDVQTRSQPIVQGDKQSETE